MQNLPERAGASDAQAHASSASTSVDVRCALTLARVALQAISDLHPEGVSAVHDALSHEIEAARKDPHPDTLAVIAILSDVRASLLDQDAQPSGDDNAWYID